MIQSRQDLLEYMEADRKSCHYSGSRPRLFRNCSDMIWRYLIHLRKCEYYKNCRTGLRGGV